MTARVALEAAMRRLAVTHQLKIRGISTGRLFMRLLYEDLITGSDRAKFTKLIRKLNAVAHGGSCDAERAKLILSETSEALEILGSEPRAEERDRA